MALRLLGMQVVLSSSYNFVYILIQINIALIKANIMFKQLYSYDWSVISKELFHKDISIKIC